MRWFGAMRAMGPGFASSEQGMARTVCLRREGLARTVLVSDCAVVLVGSTGEDGFGMPPPRPCAGPRKAPQTPVLPDTAKDGVRQQAENGDAQGWAGDADGCSIHDSG